MNLKSIQISNYRSIKNVDILIEKLEDNSYTYGLIGENEAGKTSILKGIGFKDKQNNITVISKDHRDKNKYIDLRLTYMLSVKEVKSVIEYVKSIDKDNVFDETNYKDLILEYSKNIDSSEIEIFIVYKNKDGDEQFDVIQQSGEFYEFILLKIHKTIFWSYDERFLISQEIFLSDFFADPLNTSVPLTNCFQLAGYKIESFLNLQKEIAADSTDREDIREKLGEAVTKHIKRVWKNHDIRISFDLTPDKINFHIKDNKSKGKAKTADQRSDGFKQFISFLLTVSAQHVNSQLNNTILLLDEPETHLHPVAQEFFLEELTEISKTNNNIVFFATHSNYFIDKKHLNRNYKVWKEDDQTHIKKFDEKNSTYASVNYDVFNITSTDYHNELYGLAFDLSGITDLKKFDANIKEIIKKTPIKKNYKHTNQNRFDCSLPTYVRHQIHHPENKLNDDYTEKEFKESISILQEYIEYKSKNNTKEE
ncbi:ATP-dependent nuclease [Kaistella carnis]|uniref:ATP-dependent nuclease n=1 Tax=Kaistella carnis TaxID=1241979 RepID=UPI0028A88EC9|nr:AAA family ATPase [Kaistella carnis]